MVDNVALIIPAAGVGARLNGAGGTRKPYILLGGKPIVLHTLDRFKDIPGIRQRVLVVHPDDVDAIKIKWQSELEGAGVTDVVPGGQTRQESVSRGLEVLGAEIDIVAVHDSVRPFVSRGAIEESIQKASEVGGAVVACRMRATVKRADENSRIVETIPREDLWMAQTPQTFRKEILIRAYQAAAKDGFSVTDDSSLVERLGLAVMIVEEGPTNLKITTPDDLKMAEVMLADSAMGGRTN